MEEMLLNMLAKNNPQIANILKEIKESGKSPKDLFYEKAKQMGVDPDEALKTLQSFNK